MSKHEVYGPMFQFECKVCDYLGDCWDTEAEAVADMESHDCISCAPAWIRNEIERLRAAGDALAAQITKPCRCVEAHDGAINETCAPCAACFDWKEARRG